MPTYIEDADPGEGDDVYTNERPSAAELPLRTMSESEKSKVRRCDTSCAVKVLHEQQRSPGHIDMKKLF